MKILLLTVQKVRYAPSPTLSMSMSTIPSPKGLAQVCSLQSNCAPHSALMTQPTCPALKLIGAWLISSSHSTFQPIDPSRGAHTSVNCLQFTYKVQTVVVKPERGQPPKISSGKNRPNQHRNRQSKPLASSGDKDDNKTKTKNLKLE